jgi:hypothetical protein
VTRDTFVAKYRKAAKADPARELAAEAFEAGLVEDQISMWMQRVREIPDHFRIAVHNAYRDIVRENT